MSSEQILIVEDEAIVAKNISRELDSLGYSVCAVASCGKDAVQMAAETHPDLVLMDIVLKGELDGIETTELIRKRMDVPVVYLTAYADDHTVDRARKTEPFGYLLKPYEERELHTTIQMALRKHKMERNLKEMQGWLDSTLRCLPDAVIATDARGQIRFVNPTAESLTGWSQQDAVGNPWNSVFAVIDKQARQVVDDLGAKALHSGAAISLGNQRVLVARNGAERQVEGVVSPVYDRDANFTGLVFLFRDVTDRQRAEDLLRECQEKLNRWEKMEWAGRLAADMAHDFNQFLTAILCNISLVLAELPAGDQNRIRLEAAEVAAHEAAELVRHLRGSGVRKHSRLEPVDLNQAVGQILDFFCCLLESRIVVRFMAADDLWMVHGDRAQLKEMILNLCLNARDAVADHGELLVQTENVVREMKGGDAALPGRSQEYVCVRVSDTGVGMSAAVQARMFEPFFTTKESGKGRGMGLALVAAVVDQHAGLIECHSEVGQGTRFEIYLPRYVAAP